MADSKEIWKPITGTDGMYSVSNHGRVCSNLAPPPRYGDKWIVMDEPQKILSTRGKMGRYPSVNLSSYHGSRTVRTVHRLVMEAFVGPCPDGMIVCHADDNPENNHLSNLRYATYADNMQDAIDNGKMPGRFEGFRKRPDTNEGRSVNLRSSQWALIDQWALDANLSVSQIMRQIVREYTLERIENE